MFIRLHGHFVIQNGSIAKMNIACLPVLFWAEAIKGQGQPIYLSFEQASTKHSHCLTHSKMSLRRRAAFGVFPKTLFNYAFLSCLNFFYVNVKTYLQTGG